MAQKRRFSQAHEDRNYRTAQAFKTIDTEVSLQECNYETPEERERERAFAFVDLFALDLKLNALTFSLTLSL